MAELQAQSGGPSAGGSLPRGMSPSAGSGGGGQGGGEDDAAKFAAEEEARRTVMSQILSPEARERRESERAGWDWARGTSGGVA